MRYPPKPSTCQHVHDKSSTYKKAGPCQLMHMKNRTQYEAVHCDRSVATYWACDDAIKFIVFVDKNVSVRFA